MNLLQILKKQDLISSMLIGVVSVMTLCAVSLFLRAVANATRALDSTRPITFACNKNYEDDLGVSHISLCFHSRSYSVPFLFLFCSILIPISLYLFHSYFVPFLFLLFNSCSIPFSFLLHTFISSFPFHVVPVYGCYHVESILLMVFRYRSS